MILRTCNDENGIQFYVKKFVVVVLIRGKRNKVLHSSGRQYFYTKKAATHFINRVCDSIPQAEFYWVDPYRAHPKPEDLDRMPRKSYWCPYCQTIQEFKKREGGYKHCPVCNVSDRDFYVRTYNNMGGSKKEK